MSVIEAGLSTVVLDPLSFSLSFCLAFIQSCGLLSKSHEQFVTLSKQRYPLLLLKKKRVLERNRTPYNEFPLTFNFSIAARGTARKSLSPESFSKFSIVLSFMIPAQPSCFYESYEEEDMNGSQQGLV
ncbi:hypothetical protein BDF20DRAFT_837349 [Mycotypha africana]|uniref:uncharacterized protein n=1 Tax=Mycotypha africana TaxID=64632 RepID=UPI0022FFFC93|nr:uncharacterized protein BDF20DRAFT_837349 [Mycotypha africana]KAI8973401.1 hypothetical protein BDF20DRAFT_837349 [Mycotypha africana]